MSELLGRRPLPQAPVVEVGAIDVLLRAADLLEEFGWCQGKLGGKADGEMCLMGALMEAGNDLGTAYTIDRTQPRLVAVGVPCGPGSGGETGIAAQAEWNDAPERTKTEVVGKLREAAAL